MEHSRGQNKLFSAASRNEVEALLTKMELVQLNAGERLYGAGAVVSFVYFPIDALVSLVHEMAHGMSAEVAVVGNDGVTGTSLVLGVRTAAHSAIVQVPGYGLRMRSDLFLLELESSGWLYRSVMTYVDMLVRHVSITAACNRLHSIEERFCKWLLICLDRIPNIELALTQQFIANMLGDRRESVAIVQKKLQKAGCIRYSRRHIWILDRNGLERRACECYLAIPK